MNAKEATIAVCKPHWAGYILNVLIAVALVIVGIIGGRASVIITVAALVAAAAIIISIVIKVKTTYLELTESRIIGHIGFFNSKIMSTPLSQVQNLSLSNGLLGKILGYHTIRVSDAGSSTTEYVFRNMSGAKAFFEAAQTRMR